MFLAAPAVQAQITIGGNVYGGGNAGDTGGSTTVTVHAGDISAVYGGARMANVGGSTFVNIDGANASADILIANVYGGNDISGTIGQSNVATTLPTSLDNFKKADGITNAIDDSWKTFIRTSPCSEKHSATIEGTSVSADKYMQVIGTLYGGGNGDYVYKDASGNDLTDGDGKYIVKDATGNTVATSKSAFNKPELSKTYLELKGGCIAHVYGGGNAATVTNNTTINIDNSSDDLQKAVSVWRALNYPNESFENVFNYLQSKIKINTTQSDLSSMAFNFARVFGGNNKADMAIRPKWNLQKGIIRDLYGGGNEGRMTSPEGLLLQIEGAGMTVQNVYGGCRKADVRALYNNNDDTPVPYADIKLDPSDNPNNIPGGYAARVRVVGGHVTNVYGGNDISGNVYGGNTVGIMTRIYGNVYGGGNGSYAYTDNPKLKDDPEWGDFYYDVNAILGKPANYEFSGLESAEALNIFRPNAERVSILVRGKPGNPTIVEGGLYVGGNSASLRSQSSGSNVKNTTHVKIGSYTIIDNVFLGNNGENMIKSDEADAEGRGEGVLRTLARTDIASDGTKFNSMNLKDDAVFAKYMEGCAMKVNPTVVFESTKNGDAQDYIPYTTRFGSLFCGGNVGSIIVPGKITVDFNDRVIIFDKVVGGCNNANVYETAYNAEYLGGMLGDADPAPEGAIGDKLELNFGGLKIQPKRWNAGKTELVWNTISASTGAEVNPTGLTLGESTAEDMDRRLKGGNIYGGCYNTGHVNGNVVINLNASIVDRKGEFAIFDQVQQDASDGEAVLYGHDSYNITERRSGVILDLQGMDVLGKALNVFGGGYGGDSEIWGSTTINLNAGYTFQIFGGGEKGPIGRATSHAPNAIDPSIHDLTYEYNPNYSCYINVKGAHEGVYRGHANDHDDMAEAEFIYGGGFLGTIAGNTVINLGNGRVFNTFAGSCNADILGHTETYVGKDGFPYVRDFIYGGNDLGGRILNTANFNSRLRNDAVRSKVYKTDMLNASSYIEYVQGHVKKIFGGAYGVYDYKDPYFRQYFDADGHAMTGYSKPFLGNAFINFRPTNTNNPLSTVDQIYGAGQGYLGEEEEDKMQNSSYILIDVPQTMQTYQNTAIFGAGECGGVGMGVAKATADAPATAHQASAIIDLLSGHFHNVYGGSYKEGITRRTVINVPAGSTFRGSNIFGGAYGVDNAYPCDVYEANVNWSSSDALVGGYRTGIYGGNNNCRRTLYGKVNINAPVYYDRESEYFATVYGAGYGKDTWSQYTEVNLNDGARLYEVYGGGQLGRVMNKKSVDAWKTQADAEATEAYETAHAVWDALSDEEKAANPEPQAPNAIDLSLADGYTDNGLANALATYKYNTNVRINQGADVCGYMYNGSRSGAYAYGGGLGDADTPNTGDVHGTTYIGLFGGKVTKDLYAAGTVGSVNNKYNIATDDFNNPFIASANAYIEGGTARNVYGGGWRGSVGYHAGAISENPWGDILGETNVIIGKLDGTSFIDGIPAIERNAYGGGEGGPIYGTANITLNKGFIGYRRFNAVPTTDTDLDYIQVGSDYYQEKLHDETSKGDGTNSLYDSGCVFGGGYIDNSSVDITNVTMFGGHVRNALFGGGEIAAIGRGIINASGEDNSVRTLQGIYKAGKTNVYLYEGHVHRNVFGGGRGYNNLGDGGTLYSDGYVFGQTEVHVYGGTVGTAKELALENGNVFGGGDIGYVYSAYEQDGKLYVGIKDGTRFDDKYEGYYYTYNNGTDPYIPANFVYNENDPKWVKDDGEYVLTEDCKVLVEPRCKALAAVTINEHSYSAGQYVTTEDLSTMGNKNLDSRWSSLDPTGIIIFNAVFAGGNTSSGSSAVYANTTTVFGNATASVHDIYHRDMITLGTGRTGGLYGDGNLTFVDGYRGLNITNYGTDYYSISPEIDITTYHGLPDREAAYYQLRYKCVKECTDNEGTTYHTEEGGSKASTMTIDDLITLFDGNESILLTNPETGEKYPNPVYWEENGVCSIYAGRLMNTIQRADFCGVFGSRMVMQGAQDRVPEIVDHTNYTINRVREVSLNQKHSVIESDLAIKSDATPAANPEDQNPDDYVDLDKAIHGNYFGIYSIVNYLGGLTSDVHFLPNEDLRRTDNIDTDTYGPEKKKDGGGNVIYESDGVTPELVGDDLTYYTWKSKYKNERKRNNGTSLNKVALASGVYLELYTEKVQGTDLGLNEKDWGYITGVIELDLINVQPGIGGGFVYAKNEHRPATYREQKHSTLTALNADAITRRDFTYSGEPVEWETSGNFVHSTQTIIDDCYNVTGKYKGSDAVPAHYWFIKGSVYVYDQYISAYTGAPNAYSESVNIPLTITAASHGTMKLLNVQPNLYAYYSAPGVPLESGKKVIINDVEYHLNDPINYWDWYMLTKSEQSLFVPQTYVTSADCKYGSEDADIIPAGTVMLPENYASLKAAHPIVYHVAKQQDVDFDFVFRSSNNLGHDTGYILTYKVNNPSKWNTWYTKFDSNTAEKQQTESTGYNDGPTYHCSSDGVFGQREYKVSNLIAKEVYDTYQTMKTNHSTIPDGQASFEAAYIVTTEYDNGNKRLHVGSTVSATEAASLSGYVAPAYICTTTIPLSKTEFIYAGNRMTEAQKTEYYNRFNGGTAAEQLIADEINEYIQPAYYCTTDGLYGGDFYEAGKNYRGLAVWSSMSESDRSHFTFNYDAFDLLIDPYYSKDPSTGNVRYGEGRKYQYDAAAATLAAAEANPAGYSLTQAVNYKATYTGDATSTYNGVTLEKNKEYTREEYEKLPNEKHHYAPIDVKEAGNVYVVNTSFQIGNTPYAVGSTISSSTYNSLGQTDQGYITTLTFTDDQKNKTFYFCRHSYEVGENTEGQVVTGITGIGAEKTGTYNIGDVVPVGLVINADSYNSLPNRQTNFSIHGIAPTGTSTLFVSRNSDIFDLSKEKIITVVYQYDYEESDVSGTHVTPISERHVVNIHLQFKSGIPTVEDIKAPQIVLPGTFVGIREPHVTPGAYEVTGGGWKLFEKIGEAEAHINGIEYTPTSDPLYWYQDGYYLAYYAKTYLGETYSNYVQVSVANYHDLKKVMEDTQHHYYVDNKNVKRNSKIYITDATNGATQFKQFFDLSKSELDEHVRDCQNLEFFMHTNVNHTGEWTPVGEAGHCFSGNFHGDGYHIDGLDHSLFGKLCGNVYNLGVTGSFTSAGIADSGDGFVENCWINTTATSGFASDVKAVFGKPSDSNRKQTVNCYYPATKGYKTGDATPMPETAFRNGTVGYNLNGFYLFKRYNDRQVNSGTAYKFYTIKEDGTLSAPTEKHYTQNATYCSSGFSTVYSSGGYVEQRYADGDFRYADGEIPETVDEREYIDAEEKAHYYPIWPDDYIYFGQMLTYEWNNQRPHEHVPSRIVKNSGRLSGTDESNRIFRAPAYYQSKVMDVAHFNPSVNLVAYSKPQTANDVNLYPAYPNMTAIDFAGHNDNTWTLGKTSAGLFYPPLLDESGLNSIINRDETANILVYAPSSETNEKTYNVLTAYFTEPEYSDYYDEQDDYRRVGVAPTSTVFGHLVQSNLKATSDHLLVDKQDFNCPISYTFTGGKRMCYQRTPDLFANLNKGWETVSLPFTAELVTTQQKGEITHFYSGSQSVDANGTKIGHEYWLREYKGQKEGTNITNGIFTAAFNYPDASGSEKSVGNTFLWDYYYSKNSQQDANADTYQTYYKTGRELAEYPLLTVAKPYIIGFPGKTYYEFDLSGEWKVQNTATTAPAQLNKQTISFVSEPRITIGVSDDELTAVAANDYGFMPNYMSKKVTGYLMNTDGSSFDVTPQGGSATVPFRPYFVATTNNAPQQTRSILFDSSDSSFAIGDDDGQDKVAESVDIYAKKRKVVVTSHLRSATDVRIFNLSGLCIANFNIEPGQTIEHPIYHDGVYIVHVAGGRYKSKLAVR